MDLKMDTFCRNKHPGEGPLYQVCQNPLYLPSSRKADPGVLAMGSLEIQSWLLQVYSAGLLHNQNNSLCLWNTFYNPGQEKPSRQHPYTGSVI